MTFSEDEELLLTTLPSQIGAIVAFSGKSGPIGTMKEMVANSKAAVAGVKSMPDNSLVQMVLPHLDDDRSEAREQASAMRDRQIDRLKAKGVKSRDEMIEATIADAGVAADLLDAKADPAEAAEYKDWVLAIGMSVAEAAKEGGFLGFGGEQVSDDEEAILGRIRGALRLS